MFRLNAIRSGLRFPKPALANRFSTTSKVLQGPSSSTVEDMHDLSAEEILKESGDRKDADLRHFTGEFCLFIALQNSFYCSVNFGCVSIVATQYLRC